MADTAKVATDDETGNDAVFWQRLGSTAKKSEIMTELIKLRHQQIEGKMPTEDRKYFEKLEKAIRAEFKSIDARITAQKVIGERREVDRKARDRRKILIGAYVEKMLTEVQKTGEPKFLKPWLTKGLNSYLEKPEDRKLFEDLFSPTTDDKKNSQ